MLCVIQLSFVFPVAHELILASKYSKFLIVTDVNVYHFCRGFTLSETFIVYMCLVEHFCVHDNVRCPRPKETKKSACTHQKLYVFILCGKDFIRSENQNEKFVHTFPSLISLSLLSHFECSCARAVLCFRRSTLLAVTNW